MGATELSFNKEFFIHAKSIENRINNGDISDAIKLINETNISDKRGLRYLKHLESKIELFSGNYQECLNKINDIENKYGEYIGLSADKCCALYMIGDFLKWKSNISSLKKQLRELEFTLSTESRHKTSICLAKFLEELGEMSEALCLYNSVLEDLDKKKDDYPMLLSQIVRIKSQWSLSNNFEQQYFDLTSLNKELHHTNFQIEVTHALFLAELELFGESVALPRFTTVVDSLDGDDKNLFVFDYIEYCLRKRVNINTAMINSVDHKSCCLYQQIILDIINNQNIEISTFLGKVTMHSSLSLIQLLIINNQEAFSRYSPQFQMLVQNFDSKTKKMWQDRIALPQEHQKKSISLKDNILKHQDRSLNLSRKKNIKIILALLEQSSSYSLEEIVFKLWQVEFNESHYHRLRMAIKRFNKEASLELLIEDIIEIDSSNISLSSNIDFLTTN